MARHCVRASLREFVHRGGDGDATSETHDLSVEEVGLDVTCSSQHALGVLTLGARDDDVSVFEGQ